MITVTPMQLDDDTVVGIRVELPKTNLLAIATEKGYIMCGALDVALLNEKLSERRILAGRAVGVRTLEDLINAPLEAVTDEAEKQGIHPGMTGREALKRML